MASSSFSGNKKLYFRDVTELGLDQGFASSHHLRTNDTGELAIDDHFRDVTKMVELPKRATRKIEVIMLIRYACYLVAQNGDLRKEEIVLTRGEIILCTTKDGAWLKAPDLGAEAK